MAALQDKSSFPELKDPQHMPDTVFFGVWNETKKKWSTSPVLQYDKFSGLSSVLASVKAGDYETAKENLLHYYRNRTGVVEYDLAVNQNTLLAAELVKEKVLCKIRPG